MKPGRPGQPRFLFRANANSFGGRVYSRGGDPVEKPVPSPDSSSVSVVGGWCRSESGSGEFLDIFRWESSKTECLAEPIEYGQSRATAFASLRGLVAFNDPIKFRASELAVGLVATHPKRGRGQPDILMRDVQFGEMTLNDAPLTLEIDDEPFQKHCSMTSLDREFLENERFFDRVKSRVFSGGRKLKFGQRLPRSGGFVSTSIVTSARYRGERIAGHSVYLEGFGSLYFGELLMNSFERRLSLVRLEMGSQARAVGMGGAVDTNGSWGR